MGWRPRQPAADLIGERMKELERARTLQPLFLDALRHLEIDRYLR